MVAVSTHGEPDVEDAPSEPGMEGIKFQDRVDMLQAIDGPISLEDLTEVFNEERCPGLKGKSKLFFIQVRKAPLSSI